MRRAILAALLIAVLSPGLGRAQPPKPAHADVGPGRVAWFDVTTTDLPRSTDFYGRLFGWTFAPLQGTDLAVEIVAGGTAIGTLRVAEGPIGAYNGVVYVQVDDAQASCRTAVELGATVPPGFPFDLPDGAGAVGLFVDPCGHPLGVYAQTPLAAEAAPAPADGP